MLNIRALQKSLKEVKKVNKAIEKAFATFPNTLQSVNGLGPVWSAGIYAEIGDIRCFASDSQPAKFAGFAWKRKPSGEFEVQETQMIKAANTHLRYYLIEAANCLGLYNDGYRVYYYKKHLKVRKHQHKRIFASNMESWITRDFGGHGLWIWLDSKCWG